MAYKSYNRVLFVRIVIIVLLSAFVGWLYATHKQWLTIIMCASLDGLLIFELFHFLNKTNKQISFFIQSVKNEDTTLRFPEKTGNAILNDLHNSLNELNVVLQKTKVKSQIREQYFSEIIHSIDTGIVVLSENGSVADINPAGLDLLGIRIFTHVRQLQRIDDEFYNAISKIVHKQKLMLTLHKPDEHVQIIARCSIIRLKNEDVKLITLQDIRGELERKEIDSWIKLIRVMSHEIMNSLAPVTSIAQSLKKIWTEKISEEMSEHDNDVETTINGLDVIAERGEALKRFVQSYRILTHVPQPNYEKLYVNSFLDSLSILLSPFKVENGVDIMFNYPNTDFEISIDQQLMVQVIINLVKNSVEAIREQENPAIVISVEDVDDAQVRFVVEDNGPGIPKDVFEQIFVPFFTTKSGGTGVGLSHSRQIVRAHGGTINCKSNPGKTIFSIEI